MWGWVTGAFPGLGRGSLLGIIAQAHFTAVQECGQKTSPHPAQCEHPMMHCMVEGMG